MCDAISSALLDSRIPGASRRNILKALGLAAGGLAATAPSAGAAGTVIDLRERGGRRRSQLKVVLLGTAGGPTLFSADRSGICTAIVYRKHVYLVDLGLGAFTRLRESSIAGPPGAPNALNNVRGIFFTHMHSDHMADWPATYATGPVNSIGRQYPPIEVFGPGDRGTLPRVFPAGRPAPSVVSPDDPTPGIARMADHLDRAWAADFNDRMRDSAFQGPRGLFHFNEIDHRRVWEIDPEGRPPRLTSALEVWTDGEVRVTATLVDHHPTAPAYAYRFDTPDGSVTVSGDTAVSENLIDLAHRTDVLVHEVIDPEFVDRLVQPMPPEVGGPLREHLLASHTTIGQVGRDVAEVAQAENLVLSHLSPANNPASRWRLAQRGYRGRLTIGQDLMEISV